jgi:hypothetical protein
VIATGEHSTGTGTRLQGLLLAGQTLVTAPSCPNWLSPQQRRSFENVIAQVWFLPTDTKR